MKSNKTRNKYHCLSLYFCFPRSSGPRALLAHRTTTRGGHGRLGRPFTGTAGSFRLPWRSGATRGSGGQAAIVTDVLRGGPDLPRASPPSADCCAPPPPPTSSGARPSFASCVVSRPSIRVWAGRTHSRTKSTPAWTMILGAPTASLRTTNLTMSSVATSDACFCS